eukprot:2581198-Rhodomonas_salina.1
MFVKLEYSHVPHVRLHISLKVLGSPLHGLPISSELILKVSSVLIAKVAGVARTPQVPGPPAQA